MTKTTTTTASMTMRQLRDIVPLRPLTTVEALGLADRQATMLLELSGIEQPPVPESIIASLPRIKVERIALDHGTSGITEWHSGRWLMLINSRQVRGRQRFTIAHEFKHALDGPLSTILYPGVQPRVTDDRWEMICDSFAASLLMPRRMLKAEFCRRRVQSVKALADRFDVSQQAMAYRLVQLGLVEPVRGRHGEEGAR